MAVKPSLASSPVISNLSFLCPGCFSITDLTDLVNEDLNPAR